MSDAEAQAKARQTRLFAIVFALLVAVLGAGYFMFLRPSYVVLYNDLRPNEASAIVGELDRQGVGYRLDQGGSAILVPAGDADKLRVGLSGADLPTNGEVGFELFNESSMGLTDFAQKINYQRALQGELSRTIMSMEGVDTARVHLALPERVLFRGVKSEPRAAVTIIPKRGQIMDEPRILGVQRLVASAVPELPLANVIVLDGFGRIVSPAPAAVALPLPSELPPELAALQERYRDRLTAAVTRAVPQLSFDLGLVLVPVAAAEGSASWSAPDGRRFNLHVEVMTPAPVAADDQARIMQAVQSEVRLDESAGDLLSFRSVPPVGRGQSVAATSPVPPVAAPPAKAGGNPLWTFIAANWAALLALLAIAAILVAGRSRAAAASRAHSEEMVRRIRAQLSVEGPAHAR